MIGIKRHKVMFDFSIQFSMNVTVFLVALATLAFSASNCGAASEFSYSITDDFKTETLHYAIEQRFSVQEGEDVLPRAFYSKTFHIFGCTQASFTCKNESWAADASPRDIRALTSAVRALPAHKLELPRKWWSKPNDSFGFLTFGSEACVITAPPGHSERSRLEAVITAFTSKIKHQRRTESNTVSIEGDIIPAREITFEELLANTSKFDGKRVK